MKQEKNNQGFAVVIVIVLVLLVAGLAVGYWYLVRPRMQLNKARTLDTSLQTKSIIPRTKIVESGLNSKLTISPSDNDVISGIVTITVTEIPEEAKHVGFALIKDVEAIEKSGGPNLGFDSDPAGGWTMTLNTAEHTNGVYTIAAFVFAGDGSSNPIGVTNVQVQISN